MAHVHHSTILDKHPVHVYHCYQNKRWFIISITYWLIDC